MKRVSVSGSPRENVGKKDARRLRREGMIPCVLYGRESQIHFSTDETNFKDIVFTPAATMVNLDIEGKTYQAVLQDIQYHPVNDNILHADFLMISEESPVKIDLTVRLVGNSPGVIRGGKLQIKLRKVKVKALPADLPDMLDVDISKLNIGDTLKVGQLKHKGLEFLNAPNSVIVLVKSSRTMAAAPEEEETEGAEEAAAGENTEASEA